VTVAHGYAEDKADGGWCVVADSIAPARSFCKIRAR